MKTFKKLLAALMIITILMSFSACHKKGEIAVKIGDVEFTSAYYMCALINADNQAKAKVKEEIKNEKDESEDEAETETETETEEEIDYYSKKVEDKDYVEWVKDTAMDYLKKVAACKILCKENKVELEDEKKQNAEYMASAYWNNYGYSYYFEPNGVSEETYKAYMVDAYYVSLYFDHIYGEGGEKEIAADDVKAKSLENFILVDVIESTYDDELTDEQKASRKELLEENAKAIKDGKKTFEEVYKEYNETEEETADTTEDSEKTKPVNKYATILGAEDTSYESEDYEKYKEYKIDEPVVFELEDKTGCKMVIRRDLSADKYYLERLDSTTRHLIADDEFEDDIKDYVKKLDINVNNYAVNQFKVKKIVVPQTAS